MTEVDADITIHTVTVVFDDTETNVEQMRAALSPKGYEITGVTYICNGTMEDVIMALQVVVNIYPANIKFAHDAEGDGKIGLTDAVCIMQKITGLR